ncbi:uric acid degradation bifunctional protein TTL-like [Arachis stenosperma]|uniref:uric acid degradation bifunctional protein TTL-like n=1 Tax=Arachis stenosperma TaxID=217475 RepID=UPI0025ABA6C3|nr:uric acid degradation bifunctional protein TTL-like [Arachis stenosperma]
MSVTGQMKMKDFSSCCASTIFTKEMAIASPFSSLEHAISLAIEIWFHKMNVWCWLEAISRRSCYNEYLKLANESIMQLKYDNKLAALIFAMSTFIFVGTLLIGINVREEIWICFVTCASGKSSEDIIAEPKMRFTNKHAVELDIASQEEMKFIELQITQLLSKESAQIVNNGDGKIVNDTLDGAEIDTTDNLDDISSTSIDMSMKFDLNKVSEEDNKTLDDQQVEDDVHVTKQCFNLNKKSWFGDDLSDVVSREASCFP